MTRVWPTAAWVKIVILLVLVTVSTPVGGGRAAGSGSVVTRRDVKDVTVVAERYRFTPERIEVNEGDTVRVTVRSVDSTHGWEVKALGIDLLARKGGRAETAEFVADRPGSYPIVCSEYCGRGHKRMKGLLVVLPTSR